MRGWDVVRGVVLAGMLAMFHAFAMQAVLAQDVVVLKDGRKFSGAIEWQTSSHLGVRTDFGLVQFEKSQVRDVFTRKSEVPTRPRRASSGIMNLAGPDESSTRLEASRSRADSEARAGSEASAFPSRALDEAGRGLDTGDAAPDGRGPHAAIGQRVRDEDARADARNALVPVGRFMSTLRERMGPFFPQRPATRILLALLLFGLMLGLVQVGCRFMDLEQYSLVRGFLFNIVLILLLVAGYSLRNQLIAPLHAVLAVLAGFVVLAAAATVLFHTRAGKSTLLVAFVLFTGGASLAFITVGVVGVVHLY